MSNCRAQQREGQGRAGRQAGRVCESISEFPVVSWLLIMRVELPECLQNARRIYVNSALSSAILLAFSFFMPFAFLFFFFGFAFSCFFSCLCHLTELPLRGRPAFKQLMPTGPG